MKTITLAGGCFWGVQKYFQQFEGIIHSEVAYANGDTINPTYEEVCAGSNHAEAVHLTYDSKVLPLEKLLTYYYKVIDPTSINQQGNDQGIQYRTGIYYENPDDLKVIEPSITSLEEKIEKEVTIEVLPLENLYRAEEEHQFYLDKNPNGYCHIPSSLFNLESTEDF